MLQNDSSVDTQAYTIRHLLFSTVTLSEVKYLRVFKATTL